MTTQFANLTRPGVYLFERTAGYRVGAIASHSTIYVIGSASEGDYTPTLVTSYTDFANQFGSSLSEDTIRLIFRNDPEAIVYFVRSAISPIGTITIDSVAVGNYTVTVNGTACTAAAVGGDTPTTLQTKILAAINTNVGSIVTATASGADQIKVRLDDPDGTLTLVDTAGDLTVAVATPTTAGALDYVYAIENSFDPDDEWAQGFIIAPEAFQNLTLAGDRAAVGSAMEGLANSEGFDWVALIDCGPDHNTTSKLQADQANYSSAKGHSAYYAPYLTTLEDTLVPASPAVAAVASKRYRVEGFQEPPAGVLYPLRGVKDVDVRYGNQEQSVLNPLGINLVRNLRRKGIVIWAARTVSTDALYRFLHTRVIMNTLNGSLRVAFDQFVLTSVDGEGVYFHRVEETAISICRRFWQGRALYGATEQDAFAVECSTRNNSADDIELGNILLSVYAAPVGVAEKLLINTYRVGIGQVEASRDSGLNLSTQA